MNSNDCLMLLITVYCGFFYNFTLLNLKKKTFEIKRSIKF